MLGDIDVYDNRFAIMYIVLDFENSDGRYIEL